MAIRQRAEDDHTETEDQTMTEEFENVQGPVADEQINLKSYGTIEGPVSTGHPDIWRICWKVPCVLRNNLSSVNSPNFTIAGSTTWNVLLQLKEDADVDRISRLGVFLDSSPMEQDNPDFNINAVFEIAAENKDPLQTTARPLFHGFCRESADWGFRELVKKEFLMDEDAGFLNNDTLSIKITVRVLKDSECREYQGAMRKQPDLWLHDSKTDTGFVGLKNQGATCYMNSLLQSLYHVPALQRAVYKMPTEQEASVKRHRSASQHPAVITRQDNCNTQESVALALQRVFYHLQHSNKSVGTKQLTKSFGWDALDAFTQHDVQELDRVLCDNLEEKMKGTPVEKEVPRLFCGKLKNFVKCINVDFRSERIEDFYDLSLNVRGCKNLKESLEKYVEREKLDGDNKYMAEGHGLQDAEKGCTFSSFPPVLHLHLKRFEYDPLRDANVKINDRFEFDEEIDLAPYMEEHPGGPELYLLHSVLVHSGDVHGGHYYAYIRPDCSDKWFKFNDERVTIAGRDEAVESNFGSEEDPDRIPQGQTLMIQRNRLGPRRCSNAYMLVYVKKDAVGDVLRPLVKEDIPTHLRDRFKIEEEEEELRRKEKSEAHLKLTLKVATWKHLQQYEEVDLHDWQNVLTLQVYKTITLDQLKRTIRETADIHSENLRLWPCCKRKNETIRTQSPTRNPEDAPLHQLAPYRQGNTGHACDGVKIYVEELQPGDKSSDRIDERDALIFFKFWDPECRRLRYIGHLIFKPTTRVKSMVEAARNAFLPDHAFDDIQALEELKPDKIEDLVYVVTDESRGIERDAQLQDKQVELQSGDIIVIQPYQAAETQNCVKRHYDYLVNKVLVSFRSKKDPEKEVFEMQLHGNLDYDAICDRVAHRLNELKLAESPPAKGDKMQLWKHTHRDGPASNPAERRSSAGAAVLRDLLGNIYGADKSIVYYEELWYSVEELKSKLFLRLKILHSGKTEIKEILVEKGSTAVADALQQAREFLPVEERPPELFLCGVREGKIDRYQTFVITGLHHAYAHNTGFGLDEDCDEDLHNFSESLKLHVIGVSQRAGGVSGGYFGPYDPHNADSCRGWLLKVSHFEMDTKASRERSSSQTALLQSQPSPRHYGNPFLVRVTAEETVGDLKRKVRDALEEQYKKRKDAESNEPSIADWALWKFANSPPEELTDDTQNLDTAKCTDSDCVIGVEHPDKHRYVNTMRTVEKAIKISR